jgi:hypothetical protein
VFYFEPLAVLISDGVFLFGRRRGKKLLGCDLGRLGGTAGGPARGQHRQRRREHGSAKGMSPYQAIRQTIHRLNLN